MSPSCVGWWQAIIAPSKQLYRRYTPRLTPYLRTLLGSQALLEDVLHDVWLVVWQQAGRYQATGSVASWLFGIARHKALKAHAQAMRVQRLPAGYVGSGDRARPGAPPAPPGAGTAGAAGPVHAPPAQREAVILTYVYDYPAQAIAALQDCALATGALPVAAAPVGAWPPTLAAWPRAARPCDLPHTSSSSAPR